MRNRGFDMTVLLVSGVSTSNSITGFLHAVNQKVLPGFQARCDVAEKARMHDQGT